MKVPLRSKSSSRSLSPHALRAETARRFAQIFNPKQQKSLDAVLKPNLSDAKQHAWMSAALYGMCRFYPRYKSELITRLQKPFVEKDADLEGLLVLGIHQLAEMRLKPHAAINETVKACLILKKDWAKGLVNAILRSFQRDLRATENKVYASESAQYAHPNWFIKTVKKDWPENWLDILQANNQQAPLTLRVNQMQWTQEQALLALSESKIYAEPSATAASAVVLKEPHDVLAIPHFDQGYFSVQDASAQLAANLLLPDEDTTKSLRILDACAAPGGKTGHLLERMSASSELVAVEKFKNRAELIYSNLNRLGIDKRINVAVANASEYAKSVNQSFDRILADVPCTASGVIRRHPDIKLRRDFNQIDKVVLEQKVILESLWNCLSVGGRLLYATCSVFKAENQLQVEAFLSTNADVKVIPLNLEQAINDEYGSQILPGSDNRDGFFYALLEKKS